MRDSYLLCSSLSVPLTTSHVHPRGRLDVICIASRVDHLPGLSFPAHLCKASDGHVFRAAGPTVLLTTLLLRRGLPDPSDIQIEHKTEVDPAEKQKGKLMPRVKKTHVLSSRAFESGSKSCGRRVLVGFCGQVLV